LGRSGITKNLGAGTPGGKRGQANKTRRPSAASSGKVRIIKIGVTALRRKLLARPKRRKKKKHGALH